MGRPRTVTCPRGHSKKDPENQYIRKIRSGKSLIETIECLTCRRNAGRLVKEVHLKGPKHPGVAHIVGRELEAIERWMALKPRMTA